MFYASGGDIFDQKKGVARGICVAVFCIAANPSFALQCSFNTECVGTDACAETSFSMGMDDQGLYTDYGDLDLLHDEKRDTFRVLHARAQNAYYMLTVIGETAHLSTHLTDPAMAINYSGTCEQ